MDRLDSEHIVARNAVAVFDVGDKVKIWGRRGLLGGGLLGLALGVAFVAIPLTAHTLVFGIVGTLIVAAVEGAVIAGALAASAAAFYGKGVLRGKAAAIDRTRSSGYRPPKGGWQDGDIPLSNWPTKWAYPGTTVAASHYAKEKYHDKRNR